ncbi:TRAP transporter permease [Emcibacter sp.]|uniref:TRAP transporter permease n=1 Tax=Emcibacter sp. TaxID=1979954 RepID=UPI003A9068A6
MLSKLKFWKRRVRPDVDALEEKVEHIRHPGGIPGGIVTALAIAWSLFQLYYASPLPYLLGELVPAAFRFLVLFNDTQARAIHLTFAIVLAFLMHSFRRSSPDSHIPRHDWAIALLAGYAAFYVCLEYIPLSERVGAYDPFDLAVGGCGLLLLLEAARRTLGLPMVTVALFFLVYIFYGNGAWVPDALSWKGASFHKAMSHLWLTTEGVYGIALGVSTGFVFMFVLFGALLEKAGAGNYFIRLAFSLLGHLQGGPAKASVIASALTGLISGSSIANVVTTGTFTVPLMRKVGFSREKAGAIEVASSVNGQIMPPVMGAAAFLMVEYVGLPYTEIIKHAFLPAIISYIALFYLVHLEAQRKGMTGLPRRGERLTLLQLLYVWAAAIAGLSLLSAVVYFSLGWIRGVFGSFATIVTILLLLLAYGGLLKISASVPEIEEDTDLEHLPPAGHIFRGGLYYILPVALLIWCLMVERLSPGLSAFWASLLMVFILLTHKPLKALLRGHETAGRELRAGFTDFRGALYGGARNMIGIAIATATAGIIVGAVSLTGIGQVLASFVEILSGGNLILMLVFTGLISLVLGMGLPTTANYIVVSSLMVPVITTLGAQNGLVIELIAVHLFVFYFGIMADVTPPVGLASFAAAAVSGGDPIRTGMTAFVYSLRMIVLPFIFIFYPELLMIGIKGPLHLALVVMTAVIGMLCFAASLRGYFLVRSRHWESVSLLLTAFILLAPGFWIDRFFEAWEERPVSGFVEDMEGIADNSLLQLQLERTDFNDEVKTSLATASVGSEGGRDARLKTLGLERLKDEGGYFSAEAIFNGPLDNPKLDARLKILSYKVPKAQPADQWMYIPAVLILGMIVGLQRRRKPVKG